MRQSMDFSAEVDKAKAPAELVELAHAIARAANASAVFGAPVREGERTLIPIAQAAFRLGGADSFLGKGAGGGMTIKPLGYIVMDRSGARLRRGPQRSLALVFGLGLLAGMAFAIRLMPRPVARVAN